MSSRDAFELTRSAQALLGVRADGSWGPATDAAYAAAPSVVRMKVDKLLRDEGYSLGTVRRVTFELARRDFKLRPGTAPPSVKANNGGMPVNMERVSLKKNVSPAVAGKAGWRRQVAAGLEKAGAPLATIEAVLKQVVTESSGNLRATEDGRYSLQFIRKNLSAFKDMSDSAVQALQKDMPAFFNMAYANRNGNGNVASGDGFKYRGRGPIQLTGKGNYAAVGDYLGVNLVQDPDWVTRSNANAIASVVGFLAAKRKLRAKLTPQQVATLVNPGLRV